MALEGVSFLVWICMDTEQTETRFIPLQIADKVIELKSGLNWKSKLILKIKENPHAVENCYRAGMFAIKSGNVTSILGHCWAVIWPFHRETDQYHCGANLCYVRTEEFVNRDASRLIEQIHFIRFARQISNHWISLRITLVVLHAENINPLMTQQVNWTEDK